jgi:hypothetical protein
MRTAPHSTPGLGGWESDAGKGSRQEVTEVEGRFAQTGIPVCAQFYAQTGSRRPPGRPESPQAQEIAVFYAQTQIPVYAQFYAQTGNRRPLNRATSHRRSEITDFYAQTGIPYKKALGQ